MSRVKDLMLGAVLGAVSTGAIMLRTRLKTSVRAKRTPTPWN
jgi:hypothetical protein